MGLLRPGYHMQCTYATGGGMGGSGPPPLLLQTPPEICAKSVEKCPNMYKGGGGGVPISQ